MTTFFHSITAAILVVITAATGIFLHPAPAVVALVPIPTAQVVATTTQIVSTTTSPIMVDESIKIKNRTPNTQVRTPHSLDASAAISPIQQTTPQKTFTTPSGAVVDENNKVLNQTELDTSASLAKSETAYQQMLQWRASHQSQLDALNAQVTTLINQLGTQNSYYNQLLQQQGLPGLMSQARDLVTQIAQIQTQRDQNYAQLATANKGYGIGAFVDSQNKMTDGELAAKESAASDTLAALNISISTTQALVNRAMEEKYNPIKQQIAILLNQEKSLQDIINGPTAACNDGSFSYATDHAGACSDHGGVQNWMDQN